jgi:hypothetical protein
LSPAGQPLTGLTVLVPRARDQASDFSALLRSRGAEPLEVPTIEIRPVATTGELDRAVEDLAAGQFDWVVLTSVNGVAALRARAEASGRGPAALGAARVAAVGPATEAALRAWGVAPDLVPEVATTAALGESFPRFSGGPPRRSPGPPRFSGGPPRRSPGTPRRYMPSMRSPKAPVMAARLTFWVAVSSPSSWSSSLGMSRNRLTVSERARRRLVSSTTSWTRASTSGFSDRSR